MSHVQDLREAAYEIENTNPTVCRKLLMIAARLAPLEEFANDSIETARIIERLIQQQGIVALPVSRRN